MWWARFNHCLLLLGASAVSPHTLLGLRNGPTFGVPACPVGAVNLLDIYTTLPLTGPSGREVPPSPEDGLSAATEQASSPAIPAHAHKGESGRLGRRRWEARSLAPGYSRTSTTTAAYLLHSTNSCTQKGRVPPLQRSAVLCTRDWISAPSGPMWATHREEFPDGN